MRPFTSLLFGEAEPGPTHRVRVHQLLGVTPGLHKEALQDSFTRFLFGSPPLASRGVFLFSLGLLDLISRQRIHRPTGHLSWGVHKVLRSLALRCLTSRPTQHLLRLKASLAS